MKKRRKVAASNSTDLSSSCSTDNDNLHSAHTPAYAPVHRFRLPNGSKLSTTYGIHEMLDRGVRNSDSRVMINLKFDSDSEFFKIEITNTPGHNLSFQTPLFYEYEDEKLLYPSVFFLWRHPHFLPAVFIHEQVFRYLENGADLMAPGKILAFKNS